MAGFRPEFREDLDALLADRRSPEAHAFFLSVMRFIELRVRSRWRTMASDLLSEAEVEEVVGEALTQLISGGLARFRGESVPELIAFLRTVADRNLNQPAWRRLRERRLLDRQGTETVHAWTSSPPAPDSCDPTPDVIALNQTDQDYLRELLTAGSKVALARQRDVSRAAVSQRVSRIQARVAALTPRERADVDAWLRQAAREVLAGR